MEFTDCYVSPVCSGEWKHRSVLATCVLPDLVRVSIAAVKHHDHNHLGKERVCFGLQLLLRSGKPGLEPRVWNTAAGTQRQELMQRPWKKEAY